ncbi:g2593 [Coccomyxa viridis]|uniref:G2593 protein n=1 Tax=Coccomyxa viridis TaxID=1274662 RepID=A0ABP1FMF3_9CHLO
MAQLKKLIPAGSPTWLEVLGVFGFVGTASVTIIRVNIGVLRGELNNMKEQLQSGTKALRDDVARFQKTLEEQRVRRRWL